MRHPKLKSIIFIFSLFFSITSPFVLIGEPSGDPPIKIGAILPLSGEFAMVGQEIQRGIELGLADQKGSDLAIVYEDEQALNRAVAVSALRKLIDIDKVNVVFHAVINSAQALASILNKSKIPGIILWDNNDTVKNMGDYVFAIGYSTELAAKDMADFVFNRLKKRHVSVVSILDEWSETISSEYVKSYKALGGAIDLKEAMQPTQIDFRPIIQRIRQKKSEAIYFPMFGQAVQAFVKQARELKYGGVLLSADGLTENDLSILGPIANGIYLTQIWVDNSELRNKYQEKYGQQNSPLNLAMVAMGYDGVKLITEVIQTIRAKGEVVTPESIQNHLVGFELSGFGGRTKLSSDRTNQKREPVITIQDGKFAAVS